MQANVIDLTSSSLWKVFVLRRFLHTWPTVATGIYRSLWPNNMFDEVMVVNSPEQRSMLEPGCKYPRDLDQLWPTAIPPCLHYCCVNALTLTQSIASAMPLISMIFIYRFNPIRNKNNPTMTAIRT